MAVPTVIAVAQAGFTSSDSPSFTLNAAPAAGDFIYAGVATASSGSTQQAVAGWPNLLGAEGTELVTSDSTIAFVLVGHEVTGGEAGTTAWTITDLFTVGETGITAAICVRGGDLADLVDGFGSDMQATTGTPFRLAATNVNTAGGTAQTPTVTDGLPIRWLLKDTTGTFTTPAGHTLQIAGNTNSALSIFTRDTAAVAATDIASTNVTPDVGDEFLSATITVPPAGAPPPSGDPAIVITRQVVI